MGAFKSSVPKFFLLIHLTLTGDACKMLLSVAVNALALEMLYIESLSGHGWNSKLPIGRQTHYY